MSVTSVTPARSGSPSEALRRICGGVPGGLAEEGVSSRPMRRIFGMLGTFLAGSCGWAIGEHVGVGTAVILGAVGGGVGLYWGYKLFDQWLG